MIVILFVALLCLCHCIVITNLSGIPHLNAERLIKYLEIDHNVHIYSSIGPAIDFENLNVTKIILLKQQGKRWLSQIIDTRVPLHNVIRTIKYVPGGETALKLLASQLEWMNIKNAAKTAVERSVFDVMGSEIMLNNFIDDPNAKRVIDISMIPNLDSEALVNYFGITKRVIIYSSQGPMMGDEAYRVTNFVYLQKCGNRWLCRTFTLPMSGEQLISTIKSLGRTINKGNQLLLVSVDCLPRVCLRAPTTDWPVAREFVCYIKNIYPLVGYMTSRLMCTTGVVYRGMKLAAKHFLVRITGSEIKLNYFIKN